MPKAKGVSLPLLRWASGEGALTHRVYLGTGKTAVEAADASVFVGNQVLTEYEPGPLAKDTIYYWRVDEVNDVDPGSPWKGPVWSFATADFLVEDDFESYTDDIEGGRTIYQTWIDGIDNGTGSTVGYWEAVNGTFGSSSMAFESPGPRPSKGPVGRRSSAVDPSADEPSSPLKSKKKMDAPGLFCRDHPFFWASLAGPPSES